MSISIELALSIVLQIVTVTAVIVKLNVSMSFLKGQLERLEKKQDKHNCLIERMVVVEQGCKSAHHRIDGVEDRKK